MCLDGRVGHPISAWRPRAADDRIVKQPDPDGPWNLRLGSLGPYRSTRPIRYERAERPTRSRNGVTKPARAVSGPPRSAPGAVRLSLRIGGPNPTAKGLACLLGVQAYPAGGPVVVPGLGGRGNRSPPQGSPRQHWATTSATGSKSRTGAPTCPSIDLRDRLKGRFRSVRRLFG